MLRPLPAEACPQAAGRLGHIPVRHLTEIMHIERDTLTQRVMSSRRIERIGDSYLFPAKNRRGAPETLGEIGNCPQRPVPYRGC